MPLRRLIHRVGFGCKGFYAPITRQIHDANFSQSSCGCVESGLCRFRYRHDVSLFGLWILSQDEEVIIATTRFFRDPYKAGVPKSTPVEQKDARPGSMVDQIVGRSDTTMRNTNDTTSIDIGVLHRIAQDWYQRLRLHEIDDSIIQIDATSEGLKVVLFHGDDQPIFEPSSPRLTGHGRKVMQRMSWLLSQHAFWFIGSILIPIISSPVNRRRVEALGKCHFFRALKSPINSLSLFRQ